MKCSKFEQGIYLYDELTSRERERIDAHVNACANCMHVLNAAREMRKAVAVHHADAPPLTNHAAMTRRIMDTIADTPRRERRPSFERIALHLPHALLRDTMSLRYYMAALSFLLVVFFFLEYSGGSEQHQIFKYYPPLSVKTELNLAAFHSAFLETKKENKQASIVISDCVTRCLKVATSDCKQCADRLTKP